MQSVRGEIKWYQVAHSISHHYVTTEREGAAIALCTRKKKHTHTHLLTRAHKHGLSPDNSRTGSPFINLQHKYTQTAAVADRNWDLESGAENQKGPNPMDSFYTAFHFSVCHLITAHFEY